MFASRPADKNIHVPIFFNAERGGEVGTGADDSAGAVAPGSGWQTPSLNRLTSTPRAIIICNV